MSVLGIALSAFSLLVILAASVYFLFFLKSVKDDSVNREAPRQGIPQQQQQQRVSGSLYLPPLS